MVIKNDDHDNSPTPASNINHYPNANQRSPAKSAANHHRNGQTTTRLIDLIDTDDPEYVKNMQRPADVKEDMIDMGARKRVSAVLNSSAFRKDLEQIIEEQISQGGDCPSSLLALHHLSDVLKGIPGLSPSSNLSLLHSVVQGNCTPAYPTASLPSHIVPINDIRGPDWNSVSIPEKILRCKLASLFRLADELGWSQAIYNHISVRISSDHEHFLINPFGLLYNEITASSLVKVNMQGEILDPGATILGINKAGFMIHSAIHAARSDLKCVIHCHTASVVAVSCFKPDSSILQGVGSNDILLPLSQEALICAPLTGFHDYRGLVLTDAEREEIIRDLGPKNKILILRNHGLLACGSTIEEAFHYAFHVTIACDTQVKTLCTVAGDLTKLQLITDQNVVQQTLALTNRPDLGVDTRNGGGGGTGIQLPPGKLSRTPYKWALGEIMFEAYMRRLDTSGYKTGYPYKQGNVWRERVQQRKTYDDIEIPPSAWSASPFEYYPWDDKLFKVSDFKRKLEKTFWLNTPNAYQRVEITETGTTKPKKITKWVPLDSVSGTVLKEERDQYLIPSGTDKKEFKKLHQEIKDYRRSDKISAGPQSNVLENSSWDEAHKIQQSKNSNQVEQVIIMGAASKGIIDRNHQHNRQAYQQEYQKNPFDQIEYESAVRDYAHRLQLIAAGTGPNPNGDLTDLSTTYRSTEDENCFYYPANAALEHKFQNMSMTTTTNTQMDSSFKIDQSQLSEDQGSIGSPASTLKSHCASGNSSGSVPTSAVAGTSGGTSGTGPSKSSKKKSSLPTFRTPSFLKRKKSRDRLPSGGGTSSGAGTPVLDSKSAVTSSVSPKCSPLNDFISLVSSGTVAKDTAV